MDGPRDMKINELSCTNCGAPLQESAISVQLKAARCTHCGSIFSLESRGVPEEPEDAPLPPIPKYFRVVEMENNLEISWKWFGGHHVLIFIFGIAAALFGNLWMEKTTLGPAIIDLFGILFIAFGIGMIYFAIAGFLNTTTLSVTTDLLAVSHDPIPWLTPPDIHPGNIKQLYCRQAVSKNDNGTSCSYELYAAMNNDRHIKLISLDDYAHMRALERKIEKFLKIRDRRVAGEHVSPR